ncbi:MAG TPA: serine/threonine-protein kinase [Bryobacteraceae bacterium]|jgi:serine/threonine protein kinase|nr:serine/threonine-protein kinase [Bryobacteraceae bacterium]
MIGEILDAKYRIDKQLGAGGMGNVYLATHLGTTRVVAVKVIAPRWAAEPQFLARFQREAQACGRLRHPNIVNVTDFGVARSARGDMPYLVMEFLDGQTLSDFQQAHPQVPLPLVADLLDQIGLALEDAHRHGIVHRDLKPDNIWLEPNGRGGYTVKVLDFGVAKVNLLGAWALPTPEIAEEDPSQTAVRLPTPAGDEMETAVIEAPPEETATIAMAATPSSSSSGSFDSGAGAHTMPGSLIGTPAYMSPEQALGKEIDFRSDIYSLAVVAYFLVCGQLPFTGKSSELIPFHQTGSPPSPESIRKMPRDVSNAILAGLARNPADRPPSATAFTRRFHNAVDAEFLALRRSKAFLQQHLAAYALLLMPIYAAVLSITAVLGSVMRKLLPAATLRILLAPLAAAVFFVFADNLLRAAAALMACDEQIRVRRFLSFRVFWRLLKTMPVLVATQARSLCFFGPGWVVGDCLWPVICVVEKLSGKAAVARSRELMTGLRSAGRALAIRHLALAAFAMAEMVQSIGYLWQNGQIHQPNEVVTATWFPIFALYAGAPLFLYDRTAAHEGGPLLQLDRTPEVRTTARAFSVSSLMWLTAGALYLLYLPIKLWFFGGR